MNGGPKKEKKEHARRMNKRITLCNKSMIVQFLNWQSVLLTSKVDREMLMRGSVNI
jgi:hypothetical protein